MGGKDRQKSKTGDQKVEVLRKNKNIDTSSLGSVSEIKKRLLGLNYEEGKKALALDSDISVIKKGLVREKIRFFDSLSRKNDEGVLKAGTGDVNGKKVDGSEQKVSTESVDVENSESTEENVQVTNEGYLGEGTGLRARLITQLPTFNYEIDRGDADYSMLSRTGRAVKGEVKSAKKGVKRGLKKTMEGAKSLRTVEGWKKAGKFAGSKAASLGIPGKGVVDKLKDERKNRKEKNELDLYENDYTLDPLTRNIIRGIKKNKNLNKWRAREEALFKTGATVAKHVPAAGKLVGYGINAIGKGFSGIHKGIHSALAKGRKGRLGALIPSEEEFEKEKTFSPDIKKRDYRKRIDESNEGLFFLASESADFSRQMIFNIGERAMTIGEELERAKEHSEDGEVKPSIVKKLAVPEKARLKQKEIMGAAPGWTLEIENENDIFKKSFQKEVKKEAKKAKKELKKRLKAQKKDEKAKDSDAKSDTLPENVEKETKVQVESTKQNYDELITSADGNGLKKVFEKQKQDQTKSIETINEKESRNLQTDEEKSEDTKKDESEKQEKKKSLKDYEKEEKKIKKEIKEKIKEIKKQIKDEIKQLEDEIKEIKNKDKKQKKLMLSELKKIKKDLIKDLEKERDEVKKKLKDEATSKINEIPKKGEDKAASKLLKKQRKNIKQEYSRRSERLQGYYEVRKFMIVERYKEMKNEMSGKKRIIELKQKINKLKKEEKRKIRNLKIEKYRRLKALYDGSKMIPQAPELDKEKLHIKEKTNILGMLLKMEEKEYIKYKEDLEEQKKEIEKAAKKEEEESEEEEKGIMEDLDNDENVKNILKDARNKEE